MTELERMELAETYINRYFEFEDGVTVSQENKEYLKTYIKDISQIDKEFDFNAKRNKSIMIVLAIALGAALLFLIPFHSRWLFLVPAVTFIFLTVAGIVLVTSLHKYKLDAAKEHQKEVNEGIKEQIEILDLRIQQIAKQRDDYLTALKKKIDFMELDTDYMKNISKIKEYLVNGEAETCEDAVAIYEQSLLMQQMTSIMTASEHKEDQEMDMEKNRERFGDPLELIKENKKKKKREKKKK